jgi:acetyl-CoA decarbonylase/synthase complex subunit gamma
MAFAMQVAAKQKAITDCPHLSEEAKATLAEASTPPMRLVKIGSDSTLFEIGQETVLFRHEEKFHRPCGLAVRIHASLSDAEALEKCEKINSSVFDRVGETIQVHLAGVEIEGCASPVERVKKIAEKSKFPLMLIGKDAKTMKDACEAIKDKRPLIYFADSTNIDDFKNIAAELKIPLAVRGSSLEELADLTQKAKDAGVEDMILSFDSEDMGETIRSLTITRRSALKKNFKPFGYPSMVEINTENQNDEGVKAAAYAAKYAGIVLIDNADPWELLPILVVVQNIYTDPQVPNTVEAKLYEIGEPGENSPVLFTTNFSLTYFSVESEVERSKIPTYICVVETEGLGVLNAYAGDKISAEKVVKTIDEQKVADKVKHRKLIIPGLIPVFRAEIEDTSVWKEVIIGPESAREIPAFLTSNWKS